MKNRSWAVITGGSDGIGLAMSENLANKDLTYVLLLEIKKK